MLLDDARQLKISLLEDVLTSMASIPVIRTLGISARTSAPGKDALRSLSVGISKKGRKHLVAIRVQRSTLLDHPVLEKLKKQAKGEVDVRVIGKVSKQESAANLRKKRRPLVIGCSIGHYNVTAGTLGCFVKKRTTSTETLILSNNHVLANENRGKVGDAILQPGIIDGGQNPQDQVASLVKQVRLAPTQTNFIDCAVAGLVSGVDISKNKLGTFGTLKGLGPDFLDEGTIVRKVGRTTGETTGKVTAFELDNVVVEYGIGNVRFDNQIEIEGTGTNSFSAGGDSGSLIFTEQNLGVALLFAGSEMGGSNNMGLTYANPLKLVLDTLKVDLIC